MSLSDQSFHQGEHVHYPMMNEPRRSRNRDAILLLVVIAIVLVLTTLPYWLAERAGGDSHVFGGFLLNPIDGNSYLAKMEQGWQGDWQFRLPFSPQSSSRAYLFLFYIALGHVARFCGLSLVTTFQIARIAASILMLIALFRCFRSHASSARVYRYAFILAAFGAGMGWLLIPLGAFTADFWVAEAYPFLSAYANPHFPLTIALMALFAAVPTRFRYYGVLSIIPAVLLAVISPFGILICGGVLLGFGLLDYFQNRRISWAFYRLIWLVLGAGPIIIYDLVAVRLDPALAGWDAQNITPSPPLWDFLISFSPAIVIALLGLWRVRREIKRAPLSFASWLVLIFLLVYLPINLQRRLLAGFYLPVAGLASFGIVNWVSRSGRRFLPLAILIFILSIPSTILVLLAGYQGIRTLDPALYMGKSEADALEWVRQDTPTDALILAGPEIGLFIPARTGRRVMYGHPFETVNAEAAREAVVIFYAGSQPGAEGMAWLLDQGVDYVLYGPRERALGGPAVLADLELAYDNGSVKIFKIPASAPQ